MSEPATASVPIRVAVIGTGRIADEHLATLSRHPRVSVVGVCDLDPVLADRAARLYGGRSCIDVDRLLADTRPDAVHVTTPPATHVPLAMRAIDAGCRLVVLEKPAAPVTTELETLLAAAAARGVDVVEDHNYRFNAPMRRLDALLRDGVLGRLRAVEVRTAMPLAESRYENTVDRRAAERLPGGVLHEFLPHLCYLAAWLVPGIADVHARWDEGDPTTSVSPDRLSVSAQGVGGERVHLLFESGVAPATTTVNVHGTDGWAVADLQLATLRVTRPRGLGDQLDPLADLLVGGLGGLRATGASFLAKLRGSPIYAGIGVFLTEVYDAFDTQRPLPVSVSDMRAAARLADDVVAQRP